MKCQRQILTLILDPVVGEGSEELIPHLENQYRVLGQRDARAVMGVDSPGLVAFYTAVRYPDVVGKVAIQSMRFGPTSLQSSRLRRRPVYEEALARLEGQPPLAVQFYLDWASHERKDATRDIDLRRDNSELVERLESAGCSITWAEYAGGDGWGSMRTRST